MAFIPKGTNLDDKDVLPLLKYLDDFNGGDGMGVATWSATGEPVRHAGLKATPEELLEFCKAHPSEQGHLFHFRAASVGPKHEDLVQPFIHEHTIFAHNGTWTDWKMLFWALIAAKDPGLAERLVNDSFVVSRMVEKAGFGVLRLAPSGVFLTWQKGEPWPNVVVASGSFALSSLPKDRGAGLIYASSFPSWWSNKILEVENNTALNLTGRWPTVQWADREKCLRAGIPTSGGGRHHGVGYGSHLPV